MLTIRPLFWVQVCRIFTPPGHVARVPCHIPNTRLVKALRGLAAAAAADCCITAACPSAAAAGIAAAAAAGTTAEGAAC